MTCEFEHGVYVGRGDCHAIVLDEQESMGGGGVEDLLSCLGGRVGEVNDGYCCILILGVRHLGAADKKIYGGVKIRSRLVCQTYAISRCAGLKAVKVSLRPLQLATRTNLDGYGWL